MKESCHTYECVFCMCLWMHSYVWQDLVIYCACHYHRDVQHAVHVTWLIHIWHMTLHSHVTYLKHIGHMTPHAHVTYLILTWDRTHSHIWHDSFTCDIWHDSFACDKTRSPMWHNSFTSTHATELNLRIHLLHVPRFARHATRGTMRRDSFTRDTWLLIHVWHNSCSHVTHHSSTYYACHY